MRAVVALKLHLPLVEGSDGDLPLLRAGCRSAVLFRLDMASLRWLGVTSIFATCKVGVARTCAMRVAYTRILFRPAGHNVRTSATLGSHISFVPRLFVRGGKRARYLLFAHALNY